MIDRTQQMYDMARIYIEEFGWSLFPMFGMTPDGCACGGRPNCKPGKHPDYNLAPNGLKNATRYIEEVGIWLEERPNINLAVATGAISNLAVIDVDWYEDGAPEAFANLFDRFAPYQRNIREHTRAVQSGGGGIHFYFTHPGVHVKSVSSHKRIGKGIDIRGDGGSAMLPPSLHESGAFYEWDADEGGMYRPMQPFPEEVLVRLQFQEPVIEPLTHNRGSRAFSNKRGPIHEPGRNVELTRIAGGIWKGGASKEELRTELHQINRELCVPPMEATEVDTIAFSITNYAR